MSQRDTVAALLLEHGGITQETARRRGVGQLRTRITELRQAGWRISTGREPGVPGGHYILLAAPGEAPRLPDFGL